MQRKPPIIFAKPHTKFTVVRIFPKQEKKRCYVRKIQLGGVQLLNLLPSNICAMPTPYSKSKNMEKVSKFHCQLHKKTNFFYIVSGSQ